MYFQLYENVFYHISVYFWEKLFEKRDSLILPIFASQVRFRVRETLYYFFSLFFCFPLRVHPFPQPLFPSDFISAFIILPQPPGYCSFFSLLLLNISLFFSFLLLLGFCCCLSSSSSVCFSPSPACCSKFTSHHPLSQTASGWVATCQVLKLLFTVNKTWRQRGQKTSHSGERQAGKDE